MNLLLCLLISHPPHVPDDGHAPVVPGDIVEKQPVAAITYMDHARQAVAENKKLVVFVHKEMYPVDGAIAYRYNGNFPGVNGPAIVFSEPDGRGWLSLKEVRSDKPATFPRLTQQPIRFQRQQPLQQFQPTFGRSAGRSSGNC